MRGGGRGFSQWGSDHRTGQLRGLGAADRIPASPSLPTMVPHSNLLNKGAPIQTLWLPTQTRILVCSLTVS